MQGAIRLALACLVLSSAVGALGAEPAAEDQIRAALSRWTSDFNARDDRTICDLFARDLRYDYRGFLERDFDSICALLRQSLSDAAKRYSYALAIKEILVSGDLAIVRLVWTLTVTGANGALIARAKEPGLDVFRKGADGRWRIIRYIAYEEPRSP